MRTKSSILLCGALLLAIGDLGLAAQQVALETQSRATSIVPPYQTIGYSFLSRPGLTPPFFSHGYLIQFSPHSTSPSEPNIILYDSAGHLVDRVTAWPQGAAAVLLTSVDVGVGGRLGFAGRANRVDGSSYVFMATSDLNGGNAKFFSSGNYLASQIALAKDGSIWSIGAEYYKIVEEAGSRTKKWENYDMLRHYTSGGVLNEHFLPRWGGKAAYVLLQVDASSGKGYFSAYDQQRQHLADYGAPFYGPQAGYRSLSKVSSQSWLKIAGSQVFLYDGRTAVLYSFDPSTSTMTHSYLTAIDGSTSQINGFAVSDRGRVFASMQTTTGNIKRRLGIYELTKNSSGATGSWTLLTRTQSFPASLGGGFVVLGADKLSVVFSSRSGEVSWSKLE